MDSELIKMFYKVSFLIVYFCSVRCQNNSQGNTYDKKQANAFPIFHDLNEIMDAFEGERAYSAELVDDILNTYHNVCLFAPDVAVPETNRRPFIVLEGNHRSRRELVGKILSDRIGAKLLLVPPKCLTKFITRIGPGTILRRAFFGLSLYVAAYNVRQLWSLDTPVIMNGYWTDQTSFIINKKYVNVWNLPPEADKIFEPPQDLMPPDMIFYLHYPFSEAFNQFSPFDPNRKPLIWHIYNRFRNPKPIMFNSATGDRSVVSQLCQYINRHLSHKCDLSYTIPSNIDKI